MTTFILHQKTLIIISILAIIGVSFFFFSDSEESPYETITASRGALIQDVSVTGTVKPADDVSLSFERSGRVSAVYADVGDRVVKGEVIARLESSDLFAEFTEAQANLDAAQAKLDALIRGTRPEEIEIQQTTVEKSEANVLEEKRDLLRAIDDALIKAEDAVLAKADELFNNPTTNSVELDLEFSNTQLKADIEARRLQLQRTFTDWNILMDELDETGEVAQDGQQVAVYLNEIAGFLRQLNRGVNGLNASSDLTQTTIDGYKSDIASARADVQTALSNVTTALEDLETAKSDLSLARQELNLLQAGSTEEELAEQRARVQSLEAAVARKQAELSKTIIRAPFTGVITKQEAKVGETQAANQAVATLISEDRFEIEAFVPEADIALVETGDHAAFTLDAYGDDELFTAEVFTVDPAETQIEGVSTYKVVLAFEDREGLVRSGMTANVDIRTAEKEDVIAVPARAITEKEDGARFVRILKEDGTVEERVVTTGLRGSDGRVEIDGVEEGEEIIVFERQ